MGIYTGKTSSQTRADIFFDYETGGYLRVSVYAEAMRADL